MSKPYDFEAIETKWQKRWLDSGVFEVTEDPKKRPEYYCLEMLPYPSGKIHMGHVRNYSIGDAIARFKRMRGFNVLHPIGWDALGLPAENAALQHGEHPEDWTRANINHMKQQLRRMGFSYSWEREIATCDPEYYRWNQWFFIQMWKKGLAYRKESAVNWCPDCRTVLANEQVEAGKCWRCGNDVIQKELEQWFLKITNYADELLTAMDSMDGWPETVLTLQRNWIGRSDGAEIDFALEEPEKGGPIRVFTTRVDTIFGATFVVLAPEHPLSEQFARANDELRSYAERTKVEDKETRLDEEREKTGVATGHYAINPYTEERVPIWVADYVLMDYGTGAVMAVPAHDERDFAFAKKYDLPIRVAVQPPEANLEVGTMEAAWCDYGTVVDSGSFSGLPSKDALIAMADHAEDKGFGTKAVTYRLRDWGVSRQRYWGTPIPMVFCEGDCGVRPVPEDKLPVVLPREVTITGKGDSVLREYEDFVRTECPKCGRPARRETDTMDTFVDSAWYFYRYTDPHNDSAPFDPERAKYWFPIDLYIGGVEHAILHLIYSRFWTKVMRDLGLVEVDEPVVRQLSQGMVIKDGAKMSKSKGNVVDPDAVVEKYGADTLRLYALFEAPPEKEMNWTDERLEGPARFLQRVWRFVDNEVEVLKETPDIDGTENWGESEMSLRRKTHQTMLRVTRDVEERLHLNTAIAAIMELTNELYKHIDPRPQRSDTWKAIREATKAVVVLLSPFAPHIAEEMWERLGQKKGLKAVEWPVYDPEIAAEERITLVVQVNGKLRSRLSVPADLEREELEQRALADETVKSYIDGKEIRRVVVVPGRLVNVVVS